MERINFGYVWIGSRSDKERGIDRIKRAVFKNEYVNGGLKIKNKLHFFDSKTVKAPNLQTFFKLF